MNFEILKTNVERSVRTSLDKFADFSGRASRPEYWYFMIPVFIILFVTNLVDALLLGMPVLSLLATLAILVPTLSVGARRLHDTNRSGWWLLVGLIPVVGAIALIYFLCQPGTAGQNQFGSEPSTASFGALAQV